MTKESGAAALCLRDARPPAGSGVCRKSRLRWYSSSAMAGPHLLAKRTRPGRVPASRPELVGQILEIAGDDRKIVLGLEVARLLRPVLVGAADKGRLHAVPGGVGEVAVVRRDHHHGAGVAVAEELDRRSIHLGVGL